MCLYLMRRSPVGGDSETIRVLCVDDDESFLRLTETMLAKAEDRFEIETETRPSDVLDRLAEFEPDCLVSDYEMPQMDGLALYDAVRDRDIGVPFVLFTGRGSEEIASEAISRGVTEYLQKEGGTDQYRVLANRIEQAVERDRAEAELAFERDRRDALFSNNPDPVVEGHWRDDAGESEVSALDVNQAFVEVFGHDTDTAKGTNVDELVLPERTAAEGIRDAVSEAESIQREVRRKTADGTRDFLLTHVPLDGDWSNHAGYGIYTDITDRKERERRIEALQSRAQSLIRAETVGEVASEATDIARFVLDVPYAAVYVHEDDNTVAPGTERGDGPDERLTVQSVTDPVVETTGDSHSYHSTANTPPDSTVWESFETGTPRAITPETGLSLGPETPIVTGAIQPLGDHGVLVLGASDESAFDETVDALAEVVGANLTAALDRIERERVLATLHTVATEIQACDSVRAVCERTIDAAEEILDFEISVIDVHDDGQLVPVALSSEWDPMDATVVDADEGLTGTTFQTGETRLVGDIPGHPETKPQNERFLSVLSVPIGDTGVFQAVETEFDAFDRRDAELAELLVAHTARAMDGLSFERDI